MSNDNTQDGAEPSPASAGSVDELGPVPPATDTGIRLSLLRWIPVTERLPAMGQQVLVVALGRVITATRRDGWWRHEIDTGTQTFSLGVCTPTYWMPLPAPPETSK